MKNQSNGHQSAQNTLTTNPNQPLIKQLSSLMMTASGLQFELLSELGTTTANDLIRLRDKAQRLIDCIDGLTKGRVEL